MATSLSSGDLSLLVQVTDEVMKHRIKASAEMNDGRGDQLINILISSASVPEDLIGVDDSSPEGPRFKSYPQHQSGRAFESVSHELIFRQISPLGDPATQSMTSSSHEKMPVHTDAGFE